MFDVIKAQKIFARMVSTDHDGERLSAASTLTAMIQRAGIAPSDVQVFPRGAAEHEDDESDILNYLRSQDVEDYEDFLSWLDAREEKLKEGRDRYRAEYLRLDAENQKLKATIERQRTTRGKVKALDDEIVRLNAEIMRLQTELEQSTTTHRPLEGEGVATAEFDVFRNAVFDSLERLGICPDGLENPVECLSDEVSDLIAYREEDGEFQATLKREWRALHPARYGWKSKLHDLLSRRGLLRAKGTVYRWLSGRSKMPGGVVLIIQQEAVRLQKAGYEFMSERWWANELEGAAT